MPDDLSIDTEHIGDAVGRLELIAHGLEQSVAAHRASLNTVPAGCDEVSITAAASFHETADLFSTEIGKGVLAIRDVAAALREQSGAIDAHDSAVAGEMFVR